MSTPDGGREPQGQWSQDYTPEQAAIAQDPKNGVGIAALVFGILAILTCWFPIIGLVLGLIALILGIIGRSRVKKMQATNGGVAIAGIVLGVISIIVNILFVIFVGLSVLAFFGAGGGNTIDQLQQCLGQAQNAGSPAGVQQAIQQCQQQFSQQLPGGGQ